ncbi:MAG: hypothetical protein SOH80_08355 [Eubacteriales bacterium]|jgi:hypothetical protein
MARFGSRKKSGIRGILLTVIGCAAIVVIFAVAVDALAKGDAVRQEESLETALENDITTCYAMEGSYPESLAYLKENYGLTYDEHEFFVDYQVRGSNIRPVVTIIRKNQDEQE